MSEERDSATGREVGIAYREYEASLVGHLWRYRRARFPGRDDLFDGHVPPAPPVFRPEHALANVLTPPDEARRARLVDLLASLPRHRWLGSMKSSQALAWSVFANLAVADRLHLLADLSDDGEPLFPDVARASLRLEAEVRSLGEPTPTSLDALFEAGGYQVDGYRIAVEGKLTETEVGACSRPKLRRQDPRYCDGTYAHQGGRRERCALSEVGVAYWRHVPTLFHWSADADHRPCPLRHTYQLVRNVLAATVCGEDSAGICADAARGHAVLLYDARNPEFGPGGAAWRAVEDVRAALSCSGLLRLGTWQQVAGAMARDPEVGWLAEGLRAKYRIAAGD